MKIEAMMSEMFRPDAAGVPCSYYDDDQGFLYMPTASALTVENGLIVQEVPRYMRWFGAVITDFEDAPGEAVYGYRVGYRDRDVSRFIGLLPWTCTASLEPDDAWWVIKSIDGYMVVGYREGVHSSVDGYQVKDIYPSIVTLTQNEDLTRDEVVAYLELTT